MPGPAVLIVCSEPLGAQMAGPAIRAHELARALADEFEVTIAAPAPSDWSTIPGSRVVHAGFVDYAPLLDAVAGGRRRRRPAAPAAAAVETLAVWVRASSPTSTTRR